jgi:hypothetical protein
MFAYRDGRCCEVVLDAITDLDRPASVASEGTDEVAAWAPGEMVM